MSHYSERYGCARGHNLTLMPLGQKGDDHVRDVLQPLVDHPRRCAFELADEWLKLRRSHVDLLVISQHLLQQQRRSKSASFRSLMC